MEEAKKQKWQWKSVSATKLNYGFSNREPREEATTAKHYRLYSTIVGKKRKSLIVQIYRPDIQMLGDFNAQSTFYSRCPLNLGGNSIQSWEREKERKRENDSLESRTIRHDSWLLLACNRLTITYIKFIYFFLASLAKFHIWCRNPFYLYFACLDVIFGWKCSNLTPNGLLSWWSSWSMRHLSTVSHENVHIQFSKQ